MSIDVTTISFAVFAVCFGLCGCTNARDSSNDHENQNQQPALSDNQNNSTCVSLYVTRFSKIFTLQYSTKDVNISKFEIEHHEELFNYTSLIREDFASTCIDKNIYILNNDNDPILFVKEKRNHKKTLDVIRYNKTNNKFERTNQIKDMFANARSITSDYMGKIYWIDNVNGEFSIKVTNESFKKSEYIIHPTSQLMIKLRAYPNHNKIFFSTRDSLWYTSNLPNSSANLLISSKETGQLIDFTIDYLTDKLYWIDRFDNLYCAVIHTCGDLLYLNNIVTMEKVPERSRDYVAFNNTFYSTVMEKTGLKLYFKNVNETAVMKADI